MLLSSQRENSCKIAHKRFTINFEQLLTKFGGADTIVWCPPRFFVCGRGCSMSEIYGYGEVDHESGEVVRHGVLLVVYVRHPIVRVDVLDVEEVEQFEV